MHYAPPVVSIQKMAHTYSRATISFGMVQLSPDTNTPTCEQKGRYNSDSFFSNTDDCDQMNTWYVFSALGF